MEANNLYDRLYRKSGEYIYVNRPYNHKRYQMMLCDGLIYIFRKDEPKLTVTIDTALHLWPYGKIYEEEN